MSTQLKTRNLYFLDIFKFLCAILIVFLHTLPFQSVSPVLNMAFRNILAPIAVPFFFTATGYLLFGKVKKEDGKKTSVFLAYVKKLVRLYLIYSAIYFVFILSNWIKNGFTYKSVINYLYNFFVVGSYSTIWYLLATIVAIVLALFGYKLLGIKKTFFIALVFYAFGVLISSWYGAISTIPALKTVADGYYSVFSTVKNGGIFGLVYIMLGGVLQDINWEKKKSTATILILIGTSFLLLAIEAVVQYYFNFAIKGVDLKFALLPFTIFFFVLVVLLDKKYSNNEFLVKQKAVWLHLRKLSILIFLLQRIPLTLLDGWQIHSMIFTLVILLTTIILAEIIILLSVKIKFFKYLY